jgi:hypothetical protein
MRHTPHPVAYSETMPVPMPNFVIRKYIELCKEPIWMPVPVPVHVENISNYKAP